MVVRCALRVAWQWSDVYKYIEIEPHPMPCVYLRMNAVSF